MAGRAAWILAGGAAIVGGMVFQDDWFKFESREHDRAVAEAISEAKAERIEAREGRAQIVIDADGQRVEADPAQVEALTNAVAMLVKADAALAVAEMGSKPEPGEVAAARAIRDQARAQVDALKAQIQAGKAEEVTRDAVRERVREEVREAVNGG